MNIEKKYIEETVNNLSERLEHIKTVISNFENEVKNLDENKDSFGIGLRKGYIGAYETEKDFLVRQINFLNNSLKK